MRLPKGASSTRERAAARARADDDHVIRLQPRFFPPAVGARRLGGARRSEADHVLDRPLLAGEHLGDLLGRVVPGDERPDLLRPARLELRQVGDGRVERGRTGVDRAVEHLVLEDQVAHDLLPVERHLGLATRNAREDEDAVGANRGHGREGEVRRARRLVDEIDVADTFLPARRPAARSSRCTARPPSRPRPPVRSWRPRASRPRS